jgi:RNA polymerase sigma-70 factor (ECF subfamily)
MTTGVETAEQAFVLHRTDIYRFLLRRTHNHHEAEELTQQVFVDATSALARAGPPRSMRGWLYAVAERRLADEWRRRARLTQLVDLLAAASPVTSGDPTHTLADAVAHLPDRQRRVVVMRIVEGRTYQEIARVLGCNEAACKMRLSRALRRLRNDFDIAS